MLAYATTAVSSEYIGMWHDSEFYLKSNVKSVKIKGAKTVPCGAPVLHSSVPETHLPILTHCGLAVKQSVISEVGKGATPIPRSLSLSMGGRMVLKALEKSKNMTLTYEPATSK